MKPVSLQVTRRSERFLSDNHRVIARLFTPDDKGRIKSIIERVLSLSESEAAALLEQVYTNFRDRHKDIQAVFARHYNEVRGYVDGRDISETRQQLLGAYFTMEYSFESAALFNPSIVPHPNQDGLPDGAMRFLMSLRATGEGHVSSIVFRTGVIDRHGIVCFDLLSPYARTARQVGDQRYDKHTFFLKLIEMGAFTDDAEKVLERLPDLFNLAALSHTVDEVRKQLNNPASFQQTAENLLWLARSNYHLELPPDCDPSEIVIFPTSENESKGIEDVRLVRFTEDDGTNSYYGTYTAYNGFRVLPQIIETTDFTTISVHTLNGRYVQNKGMALFPRRVGKWYMMVSRLDGENMYLMRSQNIHFWNDATVLQAPQHPWELVQIGNCGSPIETDAGWLLLTHGVGPMRQYCIGVSLLDRDDPSKVISHLPQPLLVPTEQERDGYVPNVVYSCGAMIHHDMLFIPYAMSDTSTSFATVSVPELLKLLVP
ncbi:MAG: glycoside hydrolase family 130 protein [Phycisphaeraceae bacterium]